MRISDDRVIKLMKFLDGLEDEVSQLISITRDLLEDRDDLLDYIEQLEDDSD